LSLNVGDIGGISISRYTLYKTLRGIEFEDIWRLATANTEDGA